MGGRDMGERDIVVLLREMRPVLSDSAYGIAVWGESPLALKPFATVAEAEGLTVVAGLAEMKAVGMDPNPWARISLTIRSDLSAVGLTATISGALAAAGISANVIAGYHHDHIFVPWERRYDALAVLRELSE